MAVDYRAPHSMSLDEIGSALFADLEDAATFIDTEVGPQRAAAIHFYRAADFGDEDEGRSSVVMPLVRDTIRATLPSLMRKFFGGKHVVRFLANTPTSGKFADDATDTVNYVFTVQNDGYQVCWNAFKDALRSKTGYIKWWWDDSKEVSCRTYSNVDEQTLLANYQQAGPDTTYEIVSRRQIGVQMVPQRHPNPGFLAHVRTEEPDGVPQQTNEEGYEGQTNDREFPAHDRADYQSSSNIPTTEDQKEGLTSGSRDDLGSGGGADLQNQSDDVDLPGKWQEQGAPPGSMVHLVPEPVYSYEVRVITKKPRNRVMVVSVPTDEVIFCRDGWEWEKLRLRAHRTRKTRGELVAMGVHPEDLESIPSDDVDQLTNFEFLARQITPGIMPSQAMTATWDQVRVPYYECYYFIDADGDGISELRKICRIGRSGKIVSNEIVDECPIAMLCPDPEPHVTVGLSQADYVMDLQLIQSHVWRDVLDSLKAAIFPRTWYVEGQVNADDVLATDIGHALRARAPGMVGTLEVPFTGQQAFPLLESLDQVREQRTGIGQSAMALDGSALQSTTPAAAQATIQAAQAQVELTARLFAEGLKKMFRGILRLLCQHQDTQMNVTINGNPLTVNPIAWDPDMQALVDVGLGSGASTMERTQALSLSLNQTLQTMAQLGPENPLCGLDTLYNTLSSLLSEGGIKDTHRYWRDPKVSAQQGITLGPKGPSPEQQIAATEMAIKGATLDKDRLQIILQDEREREKNTQDAILRAIEIHAKTGTQVDIAHIQALIQRERNQTQQAIASMQPSLPAPQQ